MPFLCFPIFAQTSLRGAPKYRVSLKIVVHFHPRNKIKNNILTNRSSQQKIEHPSHHVDALQHKSHRWTVQRKWATSRAGCLQLICQPNDRWDYFRPCPHHLRHQTDMPTTHTDSRPFAQHCSPRAKPKPKELVHIIKICESLAKKPTSN